MSDVVPSVEDIHELLPRLTLAGFVTYELRGRRRDGGFNDLGELDDDDESTNEWSMRVLVQQSDNQLAIRAIGRSETADVEITSDMAAIYEKDGPFLIPDALVQEFTDRVGVMTLYPYLRQNVYDISSRLGTPVTLDILRAGQLVRGDAEPTASVTDNG